MSKPSHKPSLPPYPYNYYGGGKILADTKWRAIQPARRSLLNHGQSLKIQRQCSGGMCSASCLAGRSVSRPPLVLAIPN